MKATQQFMKGFMSCFSAFSFVKRNGMLKYYLITGLLSTLLFIAGYWFLWDFTSFLAEKLIDLLKGLLRIDEIEGSKNMSWIGKVVAWILGFILKSLALILLFKFSKYIYLILFSPLFAYLSEKTEQIVRGKVYDVSFSKVLNDAVRGIIISLRNLCIELFFIALGTLLTLVLPIAAIPISIFLFVLALYFYGFSMIDYMHERWELSIKQGIDRVREYKFRAIGIGFFFFLCNFLPIVGWIIAGVNTSVGAVLSEDFDSER